MIDLIREKLGYILGRRPLSMQVAALCRDPANGKVLLITSRGTGRWIVPKGWPMKGLSLGQAAMQEAWEEAGVQGTLREKEIGRYFYYKMHDRGFAIPVDVRVFEIQVSDLLDEFPESDERHREWFTPAEAAEQVAETGLKQLLLALPGKS